MDDAKYDVAIVGASIAGCTAATLFARRGLRVALVESKRDLDAYKQVCTHFIQPSATPTIERLGLVPALEAAGAIRNAAHLWTRWGWIRPTFGEDYPHCTYGYSVTRRALDPLLRRMAADTPGVDLLMDYAVRELLRDDDRVAGVVAQGHEARPLRLPARLVVGADGRYSPVAALAGARTTTRPNRRFMYFAYYHDLPLASGTSQQVWFLDPHLAYASPNEDGLTVVTCAPTKDLLPTFRQDPEAAFCDFVERLPDGPPIRQADRVSGLLGMLDMPNVARRPTLPGLALIGDAALASDPVWAVGCGWAFQSAEWLVEFVAPALLGAGPLDRALSNYQRRHRQALRGHQWLIDDFATGRRLNPIERLLMSAATTDDRTARHLAAFGARCTGVRQFLAPGALARALWVNAGRKLHA